jgi:glycogen synthase
LVVRILHVASEFPPARIYGLGRYVHDLTQAQVRRGHEVHVLTNSISGRDQDVEMHGTKIHRINFPSPPMPPDGATQVMVFNISLMERFLQVKAELGQVEVVVSHDWLTVMAAEALRTRLSCRWVHTMHDTVIGKTFGNLTNEDKFVAHIERFGCHSADAIVAVSRFVLEELAGPYAAPRDRLSAVPAAVSEEWFQSVDPELLPDLRSALADPNERLIAYVGRLDNEKGVADLLQACAGVMRKHPRIRLAIAGKGGEEERLRSLVGSLGLSACTHFMGYVTGGALEALYKVADLLVCPSTYEPFGIVPLEGMINAVPVIASDVGGMSELVVHGRSGIKVPPGNPGAIESAISFILDRPEEGKRLGQAGRTRAREVFNWGRVAELLEPVYAGHPRRESTPASPAVPRRRPKLTAGIRVKNGERYAEECLRELSDYVDEIVVLDDGSTDRTLDICRGYTKVRQIISHPKTWFHEGIDRNTVLALAKNTKPEWILFPDIDEVFEERFKNEIEGMMNRSEVALYAFPFFHFWRSRTHFRVDGKWGKETREFPIPRLVRNQPSLFYPVDQALGSAQIRGVIGTAVKSDIRVKHYGHLFKDVSDGKLDLYSKLDPKNDYRFMVDEEGLELEEWSE